MHTSLPRLLAIVLSFWSLAAHAATDPDIDYLIGYIAGANVRFVRGGKEYTAKEGAEHMRAKLSKAGSRVKTAEDFVTGIATKSYLSGDAYQVRLPDGKLTPTGPWLTEALSRHRAEKK